MTKVYLIIVVIYFLLNVSISAQVTISPGTTIPTQTFSIGTNAPAPLPPGWKADQQPTERTLGSFSDAKGNTDRIAAALFTGPAGIYNFGSSSSGSTTGNADRCLGGLSDGNKRTINMYLDLYNNGTTPIPGLHISYKIEKYKKGTNPAGFNIQLYYSYSGTSTSWVSAGLYFQTKFLPDANNEGYSSAPGSLDSVNKVLTLPVNIPSQSHFYLAWSYSVTSGNDATNAQALGIDNVEITALSTFTTPLPVTLLRFAGTKKDDRNMLNWSTANEMNNRGFELQRSADGNSYQAISFINSSAPGGNSATPTDYTFNDYHLTGDKQFYRLKQVDLDGKSSFSPTVVIQEQKKTEKLIITNVYPNPAKSGKLNLAIYAPVRSRLRCSIENITGHVVKWLSLDPEAGSNVFSIDISVLRAGIYHLKCVSQSGEITIRRFVVD